MGKKRGRTKINCTLGKKSSHSFSVYPSEYVELKKLFTQLKSERYKYYIQVDTHIEEGV